MNIKPNRCLSLQTMAATSRSSSGICSDGWEAAKRVNEYIMLTWPLWWLLGYLFS